MSADRSRDRHGNGDATVGVVRDGEVLAETSENRDGTRGVVAGAGGESAGEAAVSRANVEALAVSIGPGSFTGLRVGLSFAKGVAFASGARWSACRRSRRWRRWRPLSGLVAVAAMPGAERPTRRPFDEAAGASSASRKTPLDRPRGRSLGRCAARSARRDPGGGCAGTLSAELRAMRGRLTVAAFEQFIPPGRRRSPRGAATAARASDRRGPGARLRSPLRGRASPGKGNVDNTNVVS